MDCADTVDRSEITKAFRAKGIWVLSYLAAPDDTNPANCFHYICKDKNYNMDDLNANSRRDIRRGFRSFNIRLCSWDELLQKGYPAHADTAARHGYSKPSMNELPQMAQQQRSFPFFEIWGAWDGDMLVAWLQVVKVDNWAMINIVRSCTASLRMCPNNALLYAATNHLLCNEKRAYVTYGLSSSQIDVNQASMHAYKLKMGYEAIAMRRVFMPRSSIKLLVTSKLLALTLTRIARTFPNFAILKKAAGMCQQISGCATASTNVNAEHINMSQKDETQ
ncbi:MAG: hypothetical protein A2Y07_11075 [Planctomycetes bacterium GWF2_50_10]|nr:MAG: hypothetical protein A2Y07_11075 [Planctomycetes bacterium GWF2_50_10]